MTNLDKLLSVIDQEIEDSPLSHLGLQWCGLSQTEIADRMGVSRETVKRTLPSKQILGFDCMIGKTRRVLLRRHDGKTTAEFRLAVHQRQMKAEYKKGKVKILEAMSDPEARAAFIKKNPIVETGQLPPKAYGCLKEICHAWPEKYRVAIFRYSIRPANWRAFMTCYKQTALMKPDEFPHFVPKRFYQHPNIFVLCDGRHVARQLWRDYLQETGDHKTAQEIPIYDLHAD